MIKALLFILLLPPLAHADGLLFGGIVDNETRQAISGATIQVLRCHCGFTPYPYPRPYKTAQTDDHGVYSMCLPAGQYVVEPQLAEGQTASPASGIVTITDECEE
jgi:hypothetical protein